MSRIPFSSEEMKILLTNYPSLGARGTAQLLLEHGIVRSVRSIQNRASRSGIVMENIYKTKRDRTDSDKDIEVSTAPMKVTKVNSYTTRYEKIT